MWTCHVSYSCDEQRAELKNIFLNNYARRILYVMCAQSEIFADPRIPVSKYFVDEIRNVFLHKL